MRLLAFKRCELYSEEIMAIINSIILTGWVKLLDKFQPLLAGQGLKIFCFHGNIIMVFRVIEKLTTAFILHHVHRDAHQFVQLKNQVVHML